MLKNYLIIALRTIQRNRVYALINVVGLTIGITSAILIFLYLFDEVTWDHHHRKADQIYRVHGLYHLPDDAGTEQAPYIGPAVAPALAKDYPEVLNAVRIMNFDNELTENPNTTEQFFEEWDYVDSTFFAMFDLPLLAGSPAKALEEPMSLIVSREVAEKYFGSIDVLGEQIILVEDTARYSYTITGVLGDMPANSDLQFDFISNMSTLRTVFNYYLESWWNFSYQTYIELAENTDVKAFGKKINRISAEYIKDQEEGSGYRQEMFVQPLKEMHLYGKVRGEKSNRADSMYIFGVIGFFLLLIASINYMNLSTARSMTRAREVGMRKVVGAHRNQLVGQFFGESTLMAVMATLLSVAIVGVVLPFFNSFVEKKLVFNLTSQPLLPVAIVLITLFVGLLSGSYPALVLSGFNPVATLKGNFRTSSGGNWLRKALVVAQFTISIGLIASTILVYQQLQYLKNKELGFEKDNVLVLPMKSRVNSRNQFKVLQEALNQVPEIKMTAMSSQVPGFNLGGNVVRKGWDEDAAWSDMEFLAIDEDFINFYNLELLAGRGFSEEFETDENEAFLLNQSGMLRLGWSDPEEILGQQLRWQNKRGRVVGVLKDFHFLSTERPIQPMILIMDERREGFLSAKFASQDYTTALQKIQTAWNQILPNRGFDYLFLDESFDRQYQAYEKFMNLFTIFALIAILIACLGLYGLAAFTAQSRVKEIGIRKTHGASLSELVLLLTKDFSRLIGVAFFIAVPLAWLAMSYWLQDFAYSIKISPLVFIYAGFFAVLIAGLTVSYHSLKAAMANPIDALRYE